MSEETKEHGAQPDENDPRELRQRVEELHKQLASRSDELGTAEAQRDEARRQLTVTENRIKAERLLAQAGVVDVETASLLLSKRTDLGEELEAEALARSVEQLLLDKPFLRAPSQAPLPPKTASAKSSGLSAAARLAQTAERAARTGDRRDVAEYLRLRRQISMTNRKP